MLSFLGGKKKGDSEKSLAKSKIPAGIVDAIVNTMGKQGIPVLEAQAFKTFSVANDPKSDLDDFIGLLEHDEPLSARIIRIANSVFFGMKTPCSSIEEALHVIGLNEVRSILQASALKDTFASNDPIRKILWSNSVATALISRRLVTLLMPKANAGEAFLGGLLSDIGKLILLYRAPGQYKPLYSELLHEGCPFNSR